MKTKEVLFGALEEGHKFRVSALFGESFMKVALSEKLDPYGTRLRIQKRVLFNAVNLVDGGLFYIRPEIVVDIEEYSIETNDA